jgi:ATP-dependent RNA helicase DeaD
MIASLPAPFPPSLTEALNARGYADLTLIQQAVIDPNLRGQDLRLTSQTGSGKTVAVGLAIAADLLMEPAPDAPDAADAAPSRAATPRALIVAPTRELATQLRDELTWLCAPLGWRVAAVTGGTSLSGDRQLLRREPVILVGTPGRLTDHLRQGTLSLARLTSVALDEADEMLDMGFRDDLEAILNAAPPARRTHMVSATFAPDVLALAARYQRGARHVQGTQTSRANADIRHVVLPVRLSDRLAALTNLTLLAPNDRTLVFVRTRADAEGVARALAGKGFAARYLSGDLSQKDRHATLDAFRDGQTTTLIATDVAARGLDIQGVTRVIHWDLPGSPDSFTHRSGRTGRAGRTGTSFLFTPPEAYAKAQRLLRVVGVPHDVEAAPTPTQIREAQTERVLASLSDTAEGALTPHLTLAQTLLDAHDAARVVSWLLSQLPIGACTPHDLPPLTIREPRKLTSTRAPTPSVPPPPRPPLTKVKATKPRQPDEPQPQAAASDAPKAPTPPAPVPAAQPATQTPPAPVTAPAPAKAKAAKPKPAAQPAATEERKPALSIPQGGGKAPPAWIPFQVSWGSRDGADPRRLLAIVCRRGKITGDDVGAIEIGERSTRVDIALHAAAQFADASQKPDPRNPQVLIRPWLDDPKRPAKGAKAKNPTARR